MPEMPTSENVTRSLFAGLVDYAGLFPPARLDMRFAVEEYARQRRSEDAWMLSRFIVPAGRLEEFAAAGGGDEDDPWPLSVLAATAEDRARIDDFNDAHMDSVNAGATVEAVETRAATPEDVAERARTFAGLETYVEIPHAGDPAPLLAALAGHGLRAKIRTGGVTEDAFPSAAEVARFLAAAHAAGVAMKATAGLHHALRGEYRLTYEDGSPKGTMHGFLNVFLAAALVRSGAPGEDVEALLGERDAAALEFRDGVRWRGHVLDAALLASTRAAFASSYGSCSFREPVEELRRLGLL